MGRRRLIAVDCETDPFKAGRVPKPFIWGAYDGKEFITFRCTERFVDWIKKQDAIVYAHNGGKFDFMLLFRYINRTRARIINGRFVELTLGKAKLRDSYSIVPVPLGSIQKDNIDYSLMEAGVRENYMESDIIPYLRTDCEVLFRVVNAYRDVAGKAATIASNALSFSKKIGVNPGKTNARFDEEFRAFYYGGRTECFQPGTHENVNVIDIVSSYPNAMRHDHATGELRSVQTSLQGLTDDEIKRGFLEIDCYSHGAFPFKKQDGGLDFPKRKDVYRVTGWEYLVAKKHKLISNVKIKSITLFDEKINFSPYVKHWFDYKSAHDKKVDPINYTIGKIMMNSLYGKLAQNPTKYFDYEIVEPGKSVDEENGWEWFTNFDEQEIHRRSVLWKYEFDHGKDWVNRPFFNNVATGASVTGFARAHLLDAIAAIGFENAVYCDTDSIVCKGDNWQHLPMGKKLGEWEHEGEAVIGHFAGKKLYGMKMRDGKEKIASKGSKLSFEQIAAVIRGETVIWENDAPTFSLANGIQFVKREIRATSALT